MVASARPGISDEMSETKAIFFPSINFIIFEGSGVEDATKDWRDVETDGRAENCSRGAVESPKQRSE